MHLQLLTHCLTPRPVLLLLLLLPWQANPGCPPTAAATDTRAPRSCHRRCPLPPLLLFLPFLLSLRLHLHPLLLLLLRLCLHLTPPAEGPGLTGCAAAAVAALSAAAAAADQPAVYLPLLEGLYGCSYCGSCQQQQVQLRQLHCCCRQQQQDSAFCWYCCAQQVPAAAAKPGCLHQTLSPIHYPSYCRCLLSRCCDRHACCCCCHCSVVQPLTPHQYLPCCHSSLLLALLLLLLLPRLLLLLLAVMLLQGLPPCQL